MHIRWRLLLSATLLGGLVGLGLWGFWLEPSSIRVQAYPLALQRWPAPLNGLRVAVLSDLHIGSPFNGLDKLRQIVAMTNAEQPDLILIPGDLVGNGVLGARPVLPEYWAAVLSHLKAPLGVYAVLGNHDHGLFAPWVRHALENAQIPVLDEQVISLRWHGAAFWLLGIGNLPEGHPRPSHTLSTIHDDAPVLAFTHNPDIFPRVPARVNLVIAGHTHGGQVNLPLLGRLVPGSDFGQRYVIGHVVEQTDLFVSSGIGTSVLPVRFRVPPEIALLQLQSPDTASNAAPVDVSSPPSPQP